MPLIGPEGVAEGNQLPTALVGMDVTAQENVSNVPITTQVGYWIQNNPLIALGGFVAVLLFLGGGRRRY